MPTLTAIQQLNRELGDKVLADAQQNPQAYAGNFVGIANGKVIVVADNLDDVISRLHQAEPDPSNTFCVEIGADYQTVQEIWEVA